QASLTRQLRVPDFTRSSLELVGPLLLDASSDWLVVRGHDPAHPRRREKGLDVRYPFSVLGVDYVPGVVPELQPGQAEQAEVEVHHLTTDAVSGEPRTTTRFECVSADGVVSEPRRAGPLRR